MAQSGTRTIWMLDRRLGAAGGMDLAGILTQVASGAGGDGIAMILIGIIKNILGR